MFCIILEIRQQVFYVSTHFISCKSQKKNRDMWRCILNGGSDYFPHVSIAAEWMETNPRQSRYFVSLWLVNCWFGIWYVIWRYWKFTFLLCVNKIKKLKSQWTWACRMPYWHQRILCWGFITNPPPPPLSLYYQVRELFITMIQSAIWKSWLSVLQEHLCPSFSLSWTIKLVPLTWRVWILLKWPR